MRVLPAMIVLLTAALAPACHPSPSATRVIHYVALGDSYSAGEGVPPYDRGTDVAGDMCHRSASAYSRVLHVKDRVELVDRACSGARVDDLTSPRSRAEPAQLSWIDARTDVVTMTIGGNDAYFAPVVGACV